jgi:hypothetical protein
VENKLLNSFTRSSDSGNVITRFYHDCETAISIVSIAQKVAAMVRSTVVAFRA